MASEPIDSWLKAYEFVSREHTVCEACGNATEHGGKKCRGCYARWSQQLYADIGREQEEVKELARLLNKCNDDVRKAIALGSLGEPPGMSLSRDNAELMARVKRCLDGPFGPNLENKLVAIKSAVIVKETSRGRRASSEEMD